MNRTKREWVREQIAIETVASVFAATPRILVLTMIAAGLMWTLIARIGPTWLATVWFAALSLVTALRFGLVWAWSTREPPQDILYRWRRAFIALTFCAGSVWGSLAVLFYGDGSAAQQTVIAITLIAIAAVAMYSLYPVLQAYAAMAVPTLLPFAVNRAWHGGVEDLFLAFATLVFLAVAISSTARMSAKHRRWVAANLQLKALSRERRKACRAETAANRAKSLFLANMSHEIRTPMNGIVGVADLMARTPLNEEQRAYLRVMQTSGANLIAIIDDILDSAKIEAGKMNIESVPVVLHDTIRDAVDVFKGRAIKKRLELFLTIDPALPAVIYADPIRLTQIVSNLVSNAIKFTERGFVAVTCRPVSTNAGDNNKYRIEVRDTGIGVSDAARETIFGAFVQEDESTTRRFGGTGLGLAISRELARLMGGRLDVSSALGHGSNFWVELPLTAAPSTVSHIPSDYADCHYLGAVLLVEDNDVNRLVAGSMLRNLGLTVDEAPDGHCAVAAVKRGRYNLVLMDIQMPELDGIAATARIRRDELADGRKRTPIVALSANVFPEYRQQCIEAGMDGFISKPFRERELLTLLSQYFRNEQAQVQTQAQPQRQAAPPEFDTVTTDAVLDREALAQLALSVQGTVAQRVLKEKIRSGLDELARACTYLAKESDQSTRVGILTAAGVLSAYLGLKSLAQALDQAISSRLPWAETLAGLQRQLEVSSTEINKFAARHFDPEGADR